MKSKNYKILKQGNIFDIELTQDKGKIAYTSSNNNATSELHVAFFNKDKIDSDSIIYYSSKYGTHFKWGKDGNKLLYFTEYKGKSTIYGFVFK